jgi:hypothetical protein
MTYLGTPVANDNGDNVEADGDGTGPPLAHPARSERSQPGLLHGRYRLAGIAPAIGPSRLDLAEDKEPVSPRDEVQLALGSTPVPLDDLESLRLEETGRRVLAGGAECRSSVHDRTIRRR